MFRACVSQEIIFPAEEVGDYFFSAGRKNTFGAVLAASLW